MLHSESSTCQRLRKVSLVVHVAPHERLRRLRHVAEAHEDRLDVHIREGVRPRALLVRRRGDPIEHAPDASVLLGVLVVSVGTGLLQVPDEWHQLADDRLTRRRRYEGQKDAHNEIFNRLRVLVRQLGQPALGIVPVRLQPPRGRLAHGASPLARRRAKSVDPVLRRLVRHGGAV